jgi:phosphoribosyl 1,2-cyclic phosphodiesterase
MLLDLDKNVQARQMRDMLPQIRVHLHKGETLKIKDLSIESFDLTHGPGPQGPAIKCLGYVINQHFAYMTDTGRVPKAAFEALAQVHTLMIECNHDEDMAKKQAQNQPAMAYKVARQLSAFGHLSNEQCAEAILEILKKQGKNRKLQRVLLGHLSDTCNTHEIALRTVTDVLADAGYEDLEVEVAVEAELLQLGLIPSAV